MLKILFGNHPTLQCSTPHCHSPAPRFKRGYKNVISKGIELNQAGEECPVMMETSGHGAMKENFFLDDGAYLAVKAIIEMARRGLAGALAGRGGARLGIPC